MLVKKCPTCGNELLESDFYCRKSGHLMTVGNVTDY